MREPLSLVRGCAGVMLQVDTNQQATGSLPPSCVWCKACPLAWVADDLLEERLRWHAEGGGGFDVAQEPGALRHLRRFDQACLLCESALRSPTAQHRSMPRPSLLPSHASMPQHPP